MAQWLQDVSVGEWYDVAGEPFEIVGIDTKAEIVLVQHFDGTLEEFEFDTWVELQARAIAPPEDTTGALDMQMDDYGLKSADAGLSPIHGSVDDLLDARFGES